MTVSVVGTPSVVNLSNQSSATPSIATTPTAGDVVVVVVDLANVATVSSMSGLGATWTEVHYNTDAGGPSFGFFTHAIWIGTGATASGNISVTLSATRYGTVRAFHVRGLTSTSISVSSALYGSSATTTNAAGPSQTADADQFVVNMWLTNDTATTVAYPATSTPSGWTTQAIYRNIIGGNFNTSYRIPSTSATHQLTATSVTAKTHYFAQAVIGTTAGGTVPSGAASGSFTWAGAAAGASARSGSATGAFAWAGAAAGATVKSGVASGVFDWTGSAAGIAPPVGGASGTAAGSFTWAGSATGVRAPKGSSNGAYSWAGAAVGAVDYSGTAAGAFDWSGSAVGSAGSSAQGSAAGAFGWAGIAFGDNGEALTTAAQIPTPDGLVVSVPLLPVTPLATAVPVTRTSVLAPNLSAAYPAHPAQGEPGAPEVVEEVVGYPQLFINGRNVTNLRDAPTVIRRWESEAPFGDTVAAFEFPQLNPWDKPGTGDLAFLKRDARVAIGMRETTVGDGWTRVSVRRLWSGFLDARGNGLGEGEDYAWEAKGTFWQAQSQIREPVPVLEPTDIGVLIARTLNAVEGRRWGKMPQTPIGITTLTRGSRDETYFDYVQALLSEAITDDLRQWTLVEMLPGVPRLVLKPAPSTVHATVAYGTPGVDIDLRVDESTRVDRVLMRGIGPKMGGWANMYYPGIELLRPPPYPMASLTDYMGLGTTDADTVSGKGVTDWQRRVDELRGFANPAVSGVMSAKWVAVIDDLQRRVGVTADGSLGPQTWNATFDRALRGVDLTPVRLPMAFKPEAMRRRYSATGVDLGPNPAFDGRVVRDVAIDAGPGKTKAAGFRLARKILGLYGEPAANGQIVWTTDPRETDRTRLSHLSNVKVTGFEGEDRVLQVSAKTVELDTGGESGPVYVVTTRVDERARDAMVVEDLLEQRREAKADPSRRPGVANRASRQVSDQRTPWDSESPCGVLRRTAVNGSSGLWSGITIPFAEVGKLAGIRLHSTRPFMFGIFASLRITENKMASRGNPWAVDDFWRDNKDYFDRYGIIEAWGEKGNACGYSPKSEADQGAKFTGDFILDTPVDYWTETVPYVQIMVHMRGGSGWVWGEFIPAYEA